MDHPVYAIFALLFATTPLFRADRCDFAQRYSLQDLVASEQLQHEFLRDASRAEGKFARDRIGLNYVSGLTYDGTSINYDSGLPMPDYLHKFSAASKEAIHASLLALTVAGNELATEFLKSSMDGVFDGTVLEYALDQLTRKITSYENFNKTYPGFGGFIPWYKIDDSGMGRAWDWLDRVPALDNGELVWGLVAATVALSNANHTELASRYQNYVNLMATTGLNVFLKNESIMCVSHIRNVTAPPDRDNYYRGEACNLDDPYEGELFTIFMDLYGDWTNYQGDKGRDKIWVDKRAMLQAVNFTSTEGKIVVERGYWFSAHEKWKYMELPYFDVDINERIFLNGEKARTHFSYQNDYPGLFASVANVSVPHRNDTYTPNYISGPGIQEIAFEKVPTNSLVTPYGASPLLLHPTTRKYGVVWYANMLKGGRMQGPQGSSEAISDDGQLISPINTWDSKITSVLAWTGGILDLTRNYLKKTGKYDRFVQKIQGEWERVFGSSTLVGWELGFKTPKSEIKDNGIRFTACAEPTEPTCSPCTCTSEPVRSTQPSVPTSNSTKPSVPTSNSTKLSVPTSNPTKPSVPTSDSTKQEKSSASICASQSPILLAGCYFFTVLTSICSRI